MSLRRSILCSLAAAIALLEGGLGARADTLLRLRMHVPTSGDETLAESLSARGFDVVPPRGDGDRVEVVVSAAEADALRRGGYGFDVIARGAPAAADPALSKYPTLAEVTARMRRIAGTGPELARFVDVTEEYGAPATFEGRHLYALRIGSEVSRQDDDVPSVLVMAGLHPRELVNPLIALDVADRLVSGYGSDPDITAVVDANDLWIAPIWNPDGYTYVIEEDNLWRKNRQPFEEGIGVDLNRNFPYGWDSDCAGADSAASRFYKGPSAASERETRAMLAFTEVVRFDKVLEFHSPGREVVWGSPCSTFPLGSFVHDTAVELSRALGYGGRTRLSSADGEHHQWQLARAGTLSFLVETATDWQPPYQTALDEVERVWPGVLWLLRYPLSISGHVKDECTGAPLVASISLRRDAERTELSLQSGGDYGRYRAALPPGEYQLAFTAAGYLSQSHAVTVTQDSAAVLDVRMSPSSPMPCGGAAVLPVDESPEVDDWGCGCRGSSPRRSALAIILVLGTAWLSLRRRRR